MDSSDSILRQAAALTYRIGEDTLELLLVTSRETHRWIVPKGNIEPGMSAADSARQETLEEAGIKAHVVSPLPLGLYTYFKRVKVGADRPATVEVFILRAVRQLKRWPEKGQRQIAWLPLDDAIEAVQEPGLIPLLRRMQQLEGVLLRTE